MLMQTVIKLSCVTAPSFASMAMLARGVIRSAMDSATLAKASKINTVKTSKTVL